MSTEETKGRVGTTTTEEDTATPLEGTGQTNSGTPHSSERSTLEWVREMPRSVRYGTAGVLGAAAIFGGGFLLGNSGGESGKEENMAVDTDAAENTVTGVGSSQQTEMGAEPAPEHSIDLGAANIDTGILQPEDTLDDPTAFDRDLTQNKEQIRQKLERMAENNEEVFGFRGITSMPLTRTDTAEGESSFAVQRIENGIMVQLDDTLYWANINPLSGELLTHEIGHYDPEKEWLYFSEGFQVYSTTYTVEGVEDSGMFTRIKLDSIGEEGIVGTDVWQEGGDRQVLSRAFLMTASGKEKTNTGDVVRLRENRPEDIEHMFQRWEEHIRPIPEPDEMFQSS